MITLTKQFIPFNNNLYVVKKVIKEDHSPIVDVWKEHLSADTVLRKEGLLYFLERVEDLEIIA